MPSRYNSFRRLPPPLQITSSTRATPVSCCLPQLDRLWHANWYINDIRYVSTSPTLRHSIKNDSSTLRGEVSQGIQIPWYYVHNATIKWHLCLSQLSTYPGQTIRTHRCQLGSPRRIIARPVKPTRAHRSIKVMISVGVHYMAECTPPLDLEAPVHYRLRFHRGRDPRNRRMR